MTLLERGRSFATLDSHQLKTEISGYLPLTTITKYYENCEPPENCLDLEAAAVLAADSVAFQPIRT